LKREVDAQYLANKRSKFEAARPSPQFNWVTTTGEVRVVVKGEVSGHRICTFVQPIGIKGAVALTNKKREHADNIVKQSGFRLNSKKYINIFFPLNWSI
jgi:hypothetical protein